MVGVWSRTDGAKVEVKKTGEAVYLSVGGSGSFGFRGGDTHFTNLRLEGDSVIADVWLRGLGCASLGPKQTRSVIKIERTGNTFIETVPVYSAEGCQWSDEIESTEANTWTRVSNQ